MTVTAAPAVDKPQHSGCHQGYKIIRAPACINLIMSKDIVRGGQWELAMY